MRLREKHLSIWIDADAHKNNTRRIGLGWSKRMYLLKPCGRLDCIFQLKSHAIAAPRRNTDLQSTTFAEVHILPAPGLERIGNAASQCFPKLVDVHHLDSSLLQLSNGR